MTHSYTMELTAKPTFFRVELDNNLRQHYFIYNLYIALEKSLYIMSDTGFACPKCDLKFPTSEQVAEHLRNEHIDGSQTERLSR